MIGGQVFKSERYEIEVKRTDEGGDVETGEWAAYPEPHYRVKMPHQCDSWCIVPGASGKYGDGVEKRYAVEMLRAFIAEAEAALRALEADDGG